MTQPSATHALYTLHPSVAKKWWLYHLSSASEAERFRYERIDSHAVRLVAVDTLLFQVLDEIAKDLGESLDLFLTQTLADDVMALFADLQDAEILELVPHQSLLRAAMIRAGRYHISFADALAVALARDSGWPLLLADRALYDALKPLEATEPRLSVVWLVDELG